MKPDLLVRAQCPESPNNNSNNSSNNNNNNIGCELPLQQDGGSSSNSNNSPQQQHLLIGLSVIQETEIVTSSKSSDPVPMTSSSRLALNCPIAEEVGTPTNVNVFDIFLLSSKKLDNGKVSACRFGQKQKSYRKFPAASNLA